jgi:hypothetical protein
MKRAILLTYLMILGSMLTLSSISAHDGEQYTILLAADELRPENASFELGVDAYFRMADSRENMSHNITVDTNQDGVFNESDWNSGELVYSCETDENGTKNDSTCNKSVELLFNTTTGVFPYKVELSDGVAMFGNITIEEEDDGESTLEDCTGQACMDEDEVRDALGIEDEPVDYQKRLLLVVALILGGSGVYLLMSGKSRALEAEEE